MKYTFFNSRSMMMAAVLFLSLQLGAQGINFFHGTWDEALVKARTEDRIIFVDAYTTWCGPCKRMAANTFPDPAVGDFFNQYFVSMKIDMEKPEGLDFRKTYPVSSYPTLFFISPEGDVVQKAVGARGPADLIQVAEAVVGKYDRSARYAAQYEAGDRSYQLVYDYVAALNRSGKPSNKIANDYLMTQEDLNTPDNLRFILEAASQVDCQCFDLMEKHKSEIVKLVSIETVNQKIRDAAGMTVKRAIEFESPDLIDLATAAIKRHIPNEADMFKTKSQIQYALALHQLTGLEELVNTYTKKFIKNDASALHQLALDLQKYVADDPAGLSIAVSVAEKAAKEENVAYTTTYALLLTKSQAKDEALRVLDEAMKKYHEESKDYHQLQALRNKIQNG